MNPSPPRPRPPLFSRKSLVNLLFILLMLLMHTGSVHAAGSLQRDAIVSGVFFYSPACPHCHEVMLNHWPGIEERFGEQLRVVFVDVSSAEGGAVMGQTLAYLGMEPTGVPLLVIGQESMVGSLEIPARAADVIEAGLASGGVSMPPLPALLAQYDAEFARTAARTEAPPDTIGQGAAMGDSGANSSTDTPMTTDADADAGVTAAEATNLDIAAAEETIALSSAGALAQMESAAESTLMQRIARDPVANALAIIILLLLILSLALVALHHLLSGDAGARWSATGSRLRKWMLTLVGLFGVALAMTIAVGALDAPYIVALAIVQCAAFALLVVSAFQTKAGAFVSRWMAPIAAFAGLLVAGYLAYVEGTANPAVCGAVGECNLVQQSEYAAIFGIPIGLLGMAGYALILGVALVRQWAPEWFGSYDVPLLEGLTVAGVAFSIWLTFLEPFVIGATCAWCLLSALWMLALLWLVVRWEPMIKETTRNSVQTRTRRARSNQRKVHA